jgi:hypothetical protein
MKEDKRAATAEGLATQIRAIASAGGAESRRTIEVFLERRLGDLSRAETLHLLREVASQFSPSNEKKGTEDLGTSPDEKIVSLLLGRGAALGDLSPEEISVRVVKSLNTVFDTLNQIVGTIRVTLLGHEDDETTIRRIISSEIKEEVTGRSLQGYLDQIQQSFLVSHKAFGIAVESMVSRLLAELDPDSGVAAGEGHRKFGPLKKAELFEANLEKHRALKKSLDSGRIKEEFVREFERTCERLFKTK